LPKLPDGYDSSIKKQLGLDKDKIVVDIGFGTGITSVPFLKNGNVVYGVEPNKEMRTAQKKF